MFGPSVFVPRSENLGLCSENQIGQFSPELRELFVKLVFFNKDIICNYIFYLCSKLELRYSQFWFSVRNPKLSERGTNTEVPSTGLLISQCSFHWLEQIKKFDIHEVYDILVLYKKPLNVMLYAFFRNLCCLFLLKYHYYFCLLLRDRN